MPSKSPCTRLDNGFSEGCMRNVQIYLEYKMLRGINTNLVMNLFPNIPFPDVSFPTLEATPMGD